MAPDQQTKTFTVPVGTRLSHGIELEMLVAYLYKSDVDPDGANSETLAPILRVDTSEIKTTILEEVVEGVVQEHIRMTLRNHGISVKDPKKEPDEAEPDHLRGFGQWDVTTDVSVREGREEFDLVQGKPGQYRWLGVELRSPASWDEPRAYDEIRFVVNLIKSKYRVRINPSCGFHVHVANGPRFFDAKTLKRAGAFFFAADPMLSRLHAPWRRVGGYTPSIRHASQLARLDETRPIHTQMEIDHVAELFRGEYPTRYPTREYIPDLPWSDRSREKIDFGGMANWERHANERVRDGPLITLSERPRTLEPSMASEDLISPPSLNNDSDDEGGGAHFRRLLRLMATLEFRATCLRKFNHEQPERLSSKDQYTLLIMNQCESLFGHSSPNILSDAQYYDLTVACAPYIEVGRSSWEWDPRKNEFTMKDAPIGSLLGQPRPQTLQQTNGEEVVLNLQALAAVQEAEGEQQSEDATGASDSHDDLDAAVADRNLWSGIYYDWIDRLMAQPTFPLDNVESLLAQFPDPVPEQPAPEPAPEPAKELVSESSATTDTSSSSSGFNPPASKALAAANPDAFPGSRGSSPFDTSISVNFGSPASNDTRARVFAVPGTPSSSSSSSTNASNNGGNKATTASSFDSPAGNNTRARVFTVPGTPSSSSSSSTNSSGPVSNVGNEFGSLFPKAVTGGAFDSLPGIPGSSDSSPDSDGDFNPQAFSIYTASESREDDDDEASDKDSPAFLIYTASGSSEDDDHEASGKDSPASSPSLNKVSPMYQSSKITSGPKLRPHNIYELPNSYLLHISRTHSFEGTIWQRISWLPYPGGPPDPAEEHPRGSEDCIGPKCRQHIITDTRSGVATILGVDSGAAVAELLVPPARGERAIYNFRSYELSNLLLPTWPRTIEFREAGGSLDSDWIITWIKICIGMLRFCREASPIDFLTVLERVIREEERQRTADLRRDNDEDIYDVCDLLEDLCLFVEATTVRERERKFGPPR